MKVLTIKEPYASLIKNKIKKYEFRSWKTNYRGKILIHSALSEDKKGILKFKDYNLDYQKGAIVAIANIVNCIEVNDEFKNTLKKENSFVYDSAINSKEKLYAFELNDIQIIRPIFIKGKLGLWNYEGKI